MRRHLLYSFLFTAIFTMAYSQETLVKYSGNPVMSTGEEWEDRVILPGSVIEQNDTLHMWYSGGEFPLLGGSFGIGHAYSVDGLSWHKNAGNPVLDKGDTGTWDSEGVFAPSVLFKDGLFHMWYSGYNSDKTFHHIGHAISEDGINWVRDTGNPVLEGDGDVHILAPSVIFDGTEFHMLYFYTEANANKIGHATSNDGITWTKDQANPVLESGGSGNWDHPNHSYPHLYYDGYSYHAWYAGGDFLDWDKGYATSEDGFNWVKDPMNPVLSSGMQGSWDEGYLSVSSVLPDTINGKSYLRMWFTGGNSNNSEVSVGYAISLDIPDLAFTKYVNNPVVELGNDGSFDDALLAGMSVLEQGSIKHGWYAGYDGSTGTNIGYASSYDGLNWCRQKEPVLINGPSGSWDQTVNYQPHVIYEGSTYHMWFAGHAGDNTRNRIGYAASPDGLNWTKHETNPVVSPGDPDDWDGLGVGSPCVLFIEGVYHMWYTGNGDSFGIGHASSLDGLNWEKDSLNPVLTTQAGAWDYPMVVEPYVLLDKKGVYHMFFSGGEGFNWSTGYAQSFDGRHWMKYDKNPVLEPGTGAEWDKAYSGLAGVSFTADSSAFQMWYSGGGTTTVFGGEIGYATTGAIPSSADSTPCYICRLSELSIYEGGLSPEFSPGIHEYFLEVEEGTVSVNIYAIAEYPGAIINGDGEVDLSEMSPGSQISRVINVIAEDGKLCDYTIKIDMIVGMEHAALERIAIYPNPASQSLYINHVREAIISMYSVNGAIAGTWQSPGTQLDIDLTAFDPGIYILKVQLKEGVKYLRFIKE